MNKFFIWNNTFSYVNVRIIKIKNKGETSLDRWRRIHLNDHHSLMRKKEQERERINLELLCFCFFSK